MKREGFFRKLLIAGTMAASLSTIANATTVSDVRNHNNKVDIVITKAMQKEGLHTLRIITSIKDNRYKIGGSRVRGMVHDIVCGYATQLKAGKLNNKGVSLTAVDIQIALRELAKLSHTLSQKERSSVGYRILIDISRIYQIDKSAFASQGGSETHQGNGTVHKSGNFDDVF